MPELIKKSLRRLFSGKRCPYCKKKKSSSSTPRDDQCHCNDTRLSVQDVQPRRRDSDESQRQERSEQRQAETKAKWDREQAKGRDKEDPRQGEGGEHNRGSGAAT